MVFSRSTCSRRLVLPVPNSAPQKPIPDRK
jgi:hypothetical protein